MTLKNGGQLAAAIICVLFFVSPVIAEIRVANETDNTLELFLMGERETQYGPAHRKPLSSLETVSVLFATTRRSIHLFVGYHLRS